MQKSKLGRKYGWHPSKPSLKATRFESRGLPESQLPSLVDLRSKFPACYDQGQLGSCTANSIAGNIQFNTQEAWIPSRLFIYYNERALEGTVSSDAGGEIHDGIQTINQLGVCPESLPDGSTAPYCWPYLDDPQTFKKKPPKACYANAKLHLALKDQQVSLDRNTVLNTLAANHPISFGFTVPESFEDEQVIETGIMLAPTQDDQPIGGHAIIAVGYILNTPMGTQGIRRLGDNS